VEEEDDFAASGRERLEGWLGSGMRVCEST
jgi:hypothetical protein